MCDFNCKKLKCADCCGPIPFEKVFYQSVLKFKQRPIVSEREVSSFGEDFIIPVTEDISCCFLTLENSCAIYEQRPQICRDFGNGTHEHLTCPKIEPNGKIRSKKNRKLLTKRIKKNIIK
ncbi:MAG TPA: YkgJ family cysteine cluster protein [Candidatus Cloacimonas sp.]|nr:YkgJ family cysteine cluster protein [Candidatus Cloacimonas sp.]HPS60798.1 YkgJ family cysteine cluster protein [Candidatus Cloacimonas sp.]